MPWDVIKTRATTTQPKQYINGDQFIYVNRIFDELFLSSQLCRLRAEPVSQSVPVKLKFLLSKVLLLGIAA